MHLSNSSNDMFMPPVMSEPIYQDNLVGYQKCGDAYLLHHTDPAIPVHRSTRSQVTSTLAYVERNMGRFNLPGANLLSACQHLQHLWPPPELARWLLNNHLNLLHEDVLVRKVVSLPLLESVLSLLGCLHSLPVLTLGVSSSS